jgi:hypothetical protein
MITYVIYIKIKNLLYWGLKSLAIWRNEREIEKDILEALILNPKGLIISDILSKARINENKRVYKLIERDFIFRKLSYLSERRSIYCITKPGIDYFIKLKVQIYLENEVK